MDSELIFRLADRFAPEGPIGQERLKKTLALCRGQMSAVPASKLDPGTITVLKGNKPLCLGIHRQHRVVLCASESAFIDFAVDNETKLQDSGFGRAAHRPAGRLPPQWAQHVSPSDDGGVGEQNALCRLDLRRVTDASKSIRQGNRKDMDRDFIRINSVKKANIALIFSRSPRSFILF